MTGVAHVAMLFAGHDTDEARVEARLAILEGETLHDDCIS